MTSVVEEERTIGIFHKWWSNESSDRSSHDYCDHRRRAEQICSDTILGKGALKKNFISASMNDKLFNIFTKARNKETKHLCNYLPTHQK